MYIDFFFFFFFNDTATTEIYTLSLHDALPILRAHDDALHAAVERQHLVGVLRPVHDHAPAEVGTGRRTRSEEHTSELQSQSNLVCRLLLEKKNNKHSPLYP